MNLYAESSAVLAWILHEPPALSIKQALESADLVVASALTLVECERALVRARVVGGLSEFEAVRRRSLLEAASASWNLLDLSREVLERAGKRFPAEPLRTLDALHVASALAVRAAVPDLALLTLDQRVRESGASLGFTVVPA